MKANIILLVLITAGTTAFGQESKQIGRIYEEHKYREVITLANRVYTYLSREDEKLTDDLMGRSYYALQMYDSAIYFENKALELDNDATFTSGWAYAYRGMALYRQGKKEESIRDLQKSIELDKTRNSVEVAKDFLDNINNNSVPDDKCDFYYSQGEYKKAIEEGKKQLQKQEYKSILGLLGASYFNIQSYDSTIYFERKAIASDNDATNISGWAHVYLGMALYNKNEKAEAIQELQKAIALNKTSGSARKAENFLDNMINGRMVTIDSLHQAIKDKLIADDYRAAANIAITFLAANPDDALAWDQLTSAYRGLPNYDSSLYCGQRAIALDKEQSIISCEVHYFMGIDRYMKSDKEGVDNEFTATINEHTSDKLRKRVNGTRRIMGLDDTYAHWKTIETDNIIFHFQNKKHIDDADALMEKYEKEYTNVSNILPVTLPKKIDIFVWERDALTRNALANDEDIAYTNANYCVIHVAPDNNRSSQIVYILGHWQKNK